MDKNRRAHIIIMSVVYIVFFALAFGVFLAIEYAFSDYDLLSDSCDPINIEEVNLYDNTLGRRKIFLINKYSDDWILLDSLAMSHICLGFSRVEIYRKSKYTYMERLQKYSKGYRPEYDKALISNYRWFREGYDLSKGLDSTYVKVNRKNTSGEIIGTDKYIDLECK